MEKISKQDVEEWLSSPITKWAFLRLKQQQDYLKEALVNGSTLADNSGLTAQLTSRLIGELAGLEYALSYDYLKTDEEEND